MDQYLVDNLFICDKLTRNELKAHDGTVFDLCNITSPIIVFTSTEDNISPPPQTLGWIVDLYRDVDDIRAAGQTIVGAGGPLKAAERDRSAGLSLVLDEPAEKPRTPVTGHRPSAGAA